MSGYADGDGYVRRAELKNAIGGTTKAGVRDDDYDRAIAAATSQIDRWTGRRFIRDTVASTREFAADSSTRVCVGDYTDPTLMVVATYNSSTGAWDTWGDDEWRPQADDQGNGPDMRLYGEPWRWIKATGARKFPISVDGELTVQATNRWGWAEAPWQVPQACLGLSMKNFRPQDRAEEMFDDDPEMRAKALLMDLAVEGGTLYCRPLVG